MKTSRHWLWNRTDFFVRELVFVLGFLILVAVIVLLVDDDDLSESSNVFGSWCSSAIRRIEALIGEEEEQVMM